jgi:hypothetical protein
VHLSSIIKPRAIAKAPKAVPQESTKLAPVVSEAPAKLPDEAATSRPPVRSDHTAINLEVCLFKSKRLTAQVTTIKDKHSDKQSRVLLLKS